MKELSIEQKAERYDEIIDKFDVILNLNTVKESGTIFADDVRKIIPELIENEDEKIREQVVYAINQLHVCECTKNKLIAWVKKQGEQKLADLPKGEDYGIDGLYAAIDILQKTLGEVEGYQTDDGILEHQCAISAVKELSKQKPVIEMKTPEESLGISSEEYDKIVDECIYGEQRSVDKVEPKFKDGNWYQCTKDFFGKGVTFDKNTAYYCAEEGCLQDEYGCHIAIVKDLYDNFKLWTIQDAKDGDVLADDFGVILYRKIGNEMYSDVVDYHCVCVARSERFEIQKKVAYWGRLEDTKLHPATKEQRDLLFQKMKEAGYEWDANKKELKKIEQKPVE